MNHHTTHTWIMKMMPYGKIYTFIMEDRCGWVMMMTLTLACEVISCDNEMKHKLSDTDTGNADFLGSDDDEDSNVSTYLTTLNVAKWPYNQME